MFKFAYKNALTYRARFFLTGLAVALSVAFLMATLTLSTSMTGTASQDIEQANTGIDAVVQGQLITEPGGGPGEVTPNVRETLPPEIIAEIESIDGVKAIAEQAAGFTKLVDEGQALGNGTAADIGRNWVDNPTLNAFDLIAGQAPTGGESVTIDRTVADQSGITVGDTIEVVTASGLHTVTVSGLTEFGGAGNAPGQRTTFFSQETVEETLGLDGTSEVLVEFDEAADTETTFQLLDSTLPDLDVVTGVSYTTTQQETVTSALAFVSIFLLTFAVIATLAGVTIIYNTFVIAMAQRRRELALLLAVGAERRQVMRSIMVEALLIGTSATVVGVVGGLAGTGALRALMVQLGLSFLQGSIVITAQNLAISFVVGLVITCGSAWLPARHARSTAPIEALRESATETVDSSSVRAYVGVGLLVLGSAGLILSAFTSNTALLVAAILLIPGLVVGGPQLITMLAATVRPLVSRFAGIEGTVAVRNLSRNPRRSSATSLALTLGVSLVGFFAILGSSVAATTGNNLDSSTKADYVVASVSPDFSTIDPTLARRLDGVDGVLAVSPVALAEGSADGEGATIAGIDPITMTEVFDLGVREGSIDRLEEGGVAIVHEDAESPSVGDSIEVELEGGRIELPVVATVSNSFGGFDAPSHFVSDETLASVQGGLLDRLVYVATDGSSTDRVQLLVAETPGSLLQTKQQYVASGSGEVDSFLNLIYAMLSLTVLIALVGIANTMTLSMSERLREIGLLRAIGTTRKGVRRIIRFEAVLMTLAGTISGIAVASGFGWAFIVTTGGTDIPAVSWPWVTLLIVGISAVIFGTAMASVPAWRATQIPTLEAIGTV